MLISPKPTSGQLPVSLGENHPMQSSLRFRITSGLPVMRPLRSSAVRAEEFMFAKSEE